MADCLRQKGVGQQILADAVNAPVSVMETAGEGGYGESCSAPSYLVNKEENETLEDFWIPRYLQEIRKHLNPDPEGVEGFNMFMERYMKGLPIERAAVDSRKSGKWLEMRRRCLRSFLQSASCKSSV